MFGRLIRNLIGAREERRAEREGHRPCSQEPGDTGEEYADAHERRRRADGRCLAFGLFADDGDIGRRRGGTYGVARLDGRSTKRVRAGARRCGQASWSTPACLLTMGIAEVSPGAALRMRGLSLATASSSAALSVPACLPMTGMRPVSPASQVRGCTDGVSFARWAPFCSGARLC